MQVYPKFSIRVVLDTWIWLIMQSIKCPTDDIIELYSINPVNLKPLTMLDQFKNISPCANSIG